MKRKHVNFLTALLRPFDESDDGESSVKEGSHKWSDQELRDEVLTIIAAGHETTNNAMTYFFYNMAHNPDIQEKLQAEIDEALRESEELGCEPDIGKLPYLNMCISESMRLLPSVPLISRYVAFDTVINSKTQGDVHLAAGTGLVIDVAGLNRHPDHWLHPDRFYPEHFAESAVRARNKFVYVPFSIGAKNCLGIHFALQETKIIAFYLLAHFTFSPVPGFQLEEAWAITTKPAHGCLLNLTPRSPK